MTATFAPDPNIRGFVAGLTSHLQYVGLLCYIPITMREYYRIIPFRYFGHEIQQTIKRIKYYVKTLDLSPEVRKERTQKSLRKDANTPSEEGTEVGTLQQ